jgi:COP9 signalosome complex subunit 2
MKSTINPFDSQETKPYKNDPRISVMTDLVDAYQRDDIHVYEAVLSKNPDVLADPFIAENIDEVSRNMRTKAVLKLIAPYTRFSLQFISKHVRIAVPEVLDILGFLILNKQLDASIDQSTGTVVVSNPSDVERIRALREWGSSLRTLWKTALNGEGLRADEGTHGAAGAMFASGFGDESPMGMRPLNPRSRRDLRKAPGVKQSTS